MQFYPASTFNYNFQQDVKFILIEKITKPAGKE